MTSDILARVVGLRVGKRPLLFLPYALWSLVVAALLITSIPLLHIDSAAWQLSAEELIPVYMAGGTSILYALLLFFACSGGRGVNL